MADTFKRRKYAPYITDTGKALRELGDKLKPIAEYIGIPFGTIRTIAARQDWQTDSQRLQLAKELSLNVLPKQIVAIDGCNRCHCGAGAILAKQGFHVRALAPDDYKTVATVMSGNGDAKLLSLKDMGLLDLESSGESLQRATDLLRHKATADFSPYTKPVATDSLPETYDDPKRQALADAETAGRNALSKAATDPPPIKTWRDLEIASKLAGVADPDGVKDQPLINIQLLNDPEQTAKPLSVKLSEPKKDSESSSPHSTRAVADVESG